MVNFGNGMSFRVSTKRMYLPNGSEFEGVGITPDVEVIPLPTAATDMILGAALEAFAKQASRESPFR
jgi:carboxyl-terminal processing protease